MQEATKSIQKDHALNAEPAMRLLPLSQCENHRDSHGQNEGSIPWLRATQCSGMFDEFWAELNAYIEQVSRSNTVRYQRADWNSSSLAKMRAKEERPLDLARLRKVQLTRKQPHHLRSLRKVMSVESVKPLQGFGWQALRVFLPRVLLQWIRTKGKKQSKCSAETSCEGLVM